MLDFYEKRRLKNIFFSKISIGIVCGVAVLLGLSALERYRAAESTAAKRAERTIELERLKMRAATLEAEIEYLESEQGMEAEIREQYDVARPNERVVVIVGDASDQAGANAAALAPPPEPPPAPEPLWKRLLFFWR